MMSPLIVRNPMGPIVSENSNDTSDDTSEAGKKVVFVDEME